MSLLVPAVLLLAQISGGVFDYTVRPGDSLTTIGARFGVDFSVLAEANSLDASARLRVDQVLRVDNRHIVPAQTDVEVVVNIPQRMLFHFEQNEFLQAYPVAAGRRTWKTPRGDFRTETMEEQPTWDVPKSIQEEMRRTGKPVLEHVPPSPENPLGEYWIGLSLPGVGIHGTNAPSSIYGLVTHGCIRLHPDDIRDLFFKVRVGTRGRVIYEPVLITRAGNSIFLEVHRDAYRFAQDPLQKVLEEARSGGFADVLDFPLVMQVIQKREGIAHDVTRWPVWSK